MSWRKVIKSLSRILYATLPDSLFFIPFPVNRTPVLRALDFSKTLLILFYCLVSQQLSCRASIPKVELK